MMKETVYMMEAIVEAKKAMDLKEVPIGAVIVKENKIIGRGYNLVENAKNPLKHAELIAIEEATKNLGSWRLHGCTIYVTLEPCVMCAGALIYSRIDKVVFGAYDHKRGFCGSVDNICEKKELNHKVEVVPGFLEKECLNPIQDFFKTLRNNK